MKTKNTIVVLLALLMMLSSCGSNPTSNKSSVTMTDGAFQISPEEMISEINKFIDKNEYNLLDPDPSKVSDLDTFISYTYQINDSLEMTFYTDPQSATIHQIRLRIPDISSKYSETVLPAMYYMGVITAVSNPELDTDEFERNIVFGSAEELQQYSANGINYTLFLTGTTLIYSIKTPNAK